MWARTPIMNSGIIQIIRRWTKTPRFKWKRGTVVVNSIDIGEKHTVTSLLQGTEHVYPMSVG